MPTTEDVRELAAAQPPLVIFEGPDAAGKTTLAKWLASRTGSVYRSSIPSELAPFRRVIESTDPEDSFHFYASANAITYFRLAQDLDKVQVVLDRSHISTVAYHSLMLGRNLEQYSERMMASDCFSNPPLLVYVTAESAVREARARRDLQDSRFFELSLDPALHSSYEKVFERHGWSVVIVDTTDSTIDAACAELDRQLESVAGSGAW